MCQEKMIGAVIYQGHVQMFDRKCPFAQHGADDHYQSKDKALAEAQQYGAERLNAITTK